MRVYNLSKKARDDFLLQVSKFADSSSVEFVESPKDLKIAELDDSVMAIIYDKDLKLYVGRKKTETYFPLLNDEQILPKLPSATVDMGAVKFVCNGANIMRPGIVRFQGDFRKSSLLVVREISHSKAIAIGRSIESKSQTEIMKKGQAIENLHYVGDKYWEALKELQ